MTTETKNLPARIDVSKTFGEVIQELRRKKGLSQEELGFESGLHRTYVSLLERGKKSPTIMTLIQLAAALEIPPSEIIREMESRIGWTVEVRT